VPTVFNMLGPLLNPARPDYQVLGVAREEWLRPVATALAAGGLRGALVVHGLTGDGVGMDEASLEGPTRILPVREGRVLAEVVIQPEQAGVRALPATRSADSKAACVELALGLAGGVEHPDFCPRVAEEVALQAALGLLLVREADFGSLASLVEEARFALGNGLHLPSLLALAA
jgi:anthranilate phosphoribosyltransferase